MLLIVAYVVLSAGTNGQQNPKPPQPQQTVQVAGSLRKEIYQRELRYEIRFWMQATIPSRRGWEINIREVDNTDGVFGITLAFADNPDYTVVRARMSYHPKASPMRDAVLLVNKINAQGH